MIKTLIKQNNLTSNKALLSSWLTNQTKRRTNMRENKIKSKKEKNEDIREVSNLRCLGINY